MTSLSGKPMVVRLLPAGDKPNEATELAWIEDVAFVNAHKHHQVVDMHVDEKDRLRDRLGLVRDCVDTIRLWEPHTPQHQAALRRLQEAVA